MASRGVLMTAFFDQLASFGKELAEMYPDDPDFGLFNNTISIMKMTPAIMIKYVNDNVGQFEEKIEKKDETFFLNRSFDEYNGHFDMNIFEKLKQYVVSMSPDSKECVWIYIQNITRLAKACS
jgi:hypothetical protein